MRWLVLVLTIGCGGETVDEPPEEECHELNYDKVGQEKDCPDGGTPKTTTEKRGS